MVVGVGEAEAESTAEASLGEDVLVARDEDAKCHLTRRSYYCLSPLSLLFEARAEKAVPTDSEERVGDDEGDDATMRFSPPFFAGVRKKRKKNRELRAWFPF